TSNSVGDFTTLLLSINPTLDPYVYPLSWTQYTATLSGLSDTVDGRLAFRYFVTDSGPHGVNGNYIAIDTVTVGTPEPFSMLLTAGGIAAVAIRARMRRA